MIPLIQPRHHDVAAFHQPDVVPGLLLNDVIKQRANPGTGGVNQGFGLNLYLDPVASALKYRLPRFAVAPREYAAGAWQNARAELVSAARVGDHQPGVVHTAIGIDKALLKFGL